MLTATTIRQSAGSASPPSSLSPPSLLRLGDFTLEYLAVLKINWTTLDPYADQRTYDSTAKHTAKALQPTRRCFEILQLSRRVIELGNPFRGRRAEIIANAPAGGGKEGTIREFSLEG